MNTITLLTGGSRSGKSQYALKLASGYRKKGFIATATAIDEEMKERIKAHRRERGESCLTIEEPMDISGALAALDKQVDVVIVDCLTVWLGNLMHKYGEKKEDFTEVDSFLKSLRTQPSDIIIVSNEVGMGIVPHNVLARQFRDIAGSLNGKIAEMADKVILMVSGIPLILKENKK